MKGTEYGSNENVFEWRNGDEIMGVTLYQKRLISIIKKLAVKKPDQCQILKENKDGSIFAHIPVRWLKIRPERELTEEQKAIYSENARKNLIPHKNAADRTE